MKVPTPLKIFGGFFLFLIMLGSLSSPSKDVRTIADTKGVSETRRNERSDPMQTFRWAFNPMLGCKRQTTTPAQIVKKQKSCKASVIPNPSAMLILVQCAIEANGTIAGSLDYVFTESHEMCLQIQELTSKTGAE